ncbi:50S ribosomal protein L22 [Patescibacteria group bacterium]|nr:50S ribosomal protein L22 [Patescibacteria group bacterium]
MPVISKLKYLRIAPRKVRLVADLIRRKKVKEAQTILDFTTKGATKPLAKLLKTAIADAHHNFQLEPSNLYISKITVDEGPKYKRWKARSRGIAAPIQKKTSHITLVLSEIASKGKKAKKIKKVKEEEPKKKIEKPKFRPEAKTETLKPKTSRGIKRIFRRKAF